MIRSLCYLVLLSTAACGSGRVIPSDAAEPVGSPSDAGPVAAPGPGAQPAPAVAPAPDGGATPYSAYDAAASLPLRRIGQWSTSGITTPAREVIRDDSAYARFWAGLGAGARPSVDFSRDVVIAVAAGQRPSGGHGIVVSRVVRQDAGLAIDVVETVPGPGCMTTQQITQPVDVVVVAAADAKTWSFSDRAESRECR